MAISIQHHLSEEGVDCMACSDSFTEATSGKVCDPEDTDDVASIEEPIAEKTARSVQYFSMAEEDEEDEPAPRSHHGRTVGVVLFLVVCASLTFALLYYLGLLQVENFAPLPALENLLTTYTTTSAPPQQTTLGNPTCWKEGFTYDMCCLGHWGPQGNKGCWDATFNYRRCCLGPEL